MVATLLFVKAKGVLVEPTLSSCYGFMEKSVNMMQEIASEFYVLLVRGSNACIWRGYG